MKTYNFKILAVIVALLMPFTACKNWSKTAKGTTIGASAGALAGAVIGKAAGSTTTGAIVGAAVGGATGAAIGNYMDRQAEELEEELQNAEVERVGEGIKITFDGGILFDTESYTLKDPAKRDIEDLARVLKDYKDTNIMFAGHTDSRGTEEFNQNLSEQRARSVAEFAAFTGVDAERMTIVGYGESKPVATNETAEGRQQNRRVEIAIWANDELKEAAEEGRIGNQ
ncbi:OmpA family protein [Gracilimonas mengyeensis]|uniref:Outer membrane protein OmpA n=1 Tax=Gracilimonas mengyeensis TaxID=1302730 RepID=A0A521E1X1_9BACT|nr:OmpA family protein [Gracilimonas mengyeensis]SMO77882.1 Outer membrane protein OmpA [Gracilimonas mengyeensis]